MSYPEPGITMIIERPASEVDYRVSIHKPGSQPLVRKIRVRHKSRLHGMLSTALDPLEKALEKTDIEEQLRDAERIDVFLPDDPISGLNWEKLGRGRVYRRSPSNPAYRRRPLRPPFRVAFVSTSQVDANVYGGLSHSIADSTGFDVILLNLKDWESFEAQIQPDRFQAVHVLLNTELDNSGPKVVIGSARVPLQHLVAKVAQPGTRVVVLEDINEEDRAMTALRWGGQSLRADCESSILLCNAERSVGFEGRLENWYRSLWKDELLEFSMAHLDQDYERNRISLVTHSGTERPLGLKEEIVLSHRRQNQLDVDLARLTEPAHTLHIVGRGFPEDRAPAAQMVLEDPGGKSPLSGPTRWLGFTRPSQPTTSLDAPLLNELITQDTTTEEASLKLERTFKGVVTNVKSERPRYPAAWFYHADAASKTPIPDTETIVWPPSVGIGLEFHFWIDIVKTGIASLTEVPRIHKPDRLPYPLTLDVRVWSKEFHFTTKSQTITLAAAGPTKHAVFPIEKVEPAPRQGELFVFLLYEGTLIAVFRIEAAITELVEKRPGAQSFETAYLLSEWFGFSEAPSASALTVFITKKEGALQIFTLDPSRDPWARLGPTESGLYERNKEIYREVQTLANRAGRAAKDKKQFKFAKEAKRLARLGYPLFGDIFLQGETAVNSFAKQFLRPLPEGASLTIATGHELQNLYVPWGLLYDRQPPFEYFDTPHLQGFLGYRYNLVVRPSVPQPGSMPKRQLPVRMGAAWLEHEETDALRDSFRPYEEAKKLLIEPIRAKDHGLPSLTEREFDLIEFFCHGHTKVGGVFTADEASRLIENYAKGNSSDQTRELLMAIDEAGDSLLDLSGGFVTLTTLADSLDKPMPAQPLILLSMCESAQVSASGTGFVPLFLRRGARAVIGTEGPTLWSLSSKMDTEIIAKLLGGATISRAFYETRKGLAGENVLALIYTLYGDPAAKLV